MPSSASCQTGPRGEPSALRRPRPGATRVYAREALAQELLRELRVRGAARPSASAGPTRNPITPSLPPRNFCDDVGVLGDDLVGDRTQRAGVGDLREALPLDDRLDRRRRSRTPPRAPAWRRRPLTACRRRAAATRSATCRRVSASRRPAVRCAAPRRPGSPSWRPCRGSAPSATVALEQRRGGRGRPTSTAATVRLEPELVLVAAPAGARQLGQARAELLDPRGVGLERRDVGLREVPVVERLLLRAHRLGGAGVLVPVAGLLDDGLAGVRAPSSAARSRRRARARASGSSSCS